MSAQWDGLVFSFYTLTSTATVSSSSATTPLLLLVASNGGQEVHARTLTPACKNRISNVAVSRFRLTMTPSICSAESRFRAPCTIDKWYWNSDIVTSNTHRSCLLLCVCKSLIWDSRNSWAGGLRRILGCGVKSDYFTNLLAHDIVASVRLWKTPSIFSMSTWNNWKI